MSELNDFLAAEIPGLLKAAKICAECGGELIDIKAVTSVKKTGSDTKQPTTLKKDWCWDCQSPAYTNARIDYDRWQGVWTAANSTCDWRPRR